MAGGTGYIAFRLARSGAAVTVADINPAMLEVGVDRAQQRGIDGLVWTEANAETLQFPNRFFDAYTIACGIRHVTDRSEERRVGKECGRTCRSGGSTKTDKKNENTIQSDEHASTTKISRNY